MILALILALIIGLCIMGLIFGLYLNWKRIVIANDKKLEEEYMKEHPNSYGTGELRF